MGSCFICWTDFNEFLGIKWLYNVLTTNAISLFGMSAFSVTILGRGDSKEIQYWTKKCKKLNHFKEISMAVLAIFK